MTTDIPRCPHCGSILRATMPQAIRQTACGGPTSMERIKAAARTVKPDATEKEIYNAISGLVRRRHLRKIAFGWYEAQHR